VLSLLVAVVVSLSSARADDPSCKELGFGESLMCSSCKQLNTAIGGKDAGLIKECERCCIAEQEKTASASGFTHGSLDVCN